MTTQQKIYIAAGIAAILLIGFVSADLWSDHKIAKLEDQVQTAAHKAEVSGQKADELEKTAEQYRSKIDYLDEQLTQIRLTARKQDEELQKLDINTHTARGRVDAARRARSTS